MLSPRIRLVRSLFVIGLQQHASHPHLHPHPKSAWRCVKRFSRTRTAFATAPTDMASTLSGTTNVSLKHGSSTGPTDEYRTSSAARINISPSSSSSMNGGPSYPMTTNSTSTLAIRDDTSGVSLSSSTPSHRKNAQSIDIAGVNDGRRPRPRPAGRRGDLTIASHLSSPPDHHTPRPPPLTAGLIHPRHQHRHPSFQPPPNTSGLLQSPCFFHRRFDDAVNLDRLISDIASDQSMSHSRLMQTATGVREVSKQLRRRPIQRAVRSIMIVTKARDHHLIHLTRELAYWLLSTPRYGAEVGVTVYVDAKLRHSKRFDAEGLVSKDIRFKEMLRYWTPSLCRNASEKFDLVLTLGGDGTVLYTSWLFQRVVPPVLSFNLGSLGFLTNFSFDEYKTCLGRVMGESGMRVNLRMRFTCTVYRGSSGGGRKVGDVEEGGGRGEQFEVLNELVIDRGPSPYVSNLELYGDDELLTVVQADGCIFSTPTGMDI